MSRFQIGDRVIVTDTAEDWDWWIASMNRLRGAEGVVTGFQEERYPEDSIWAGTDDVFACVEFEEFDSKCFFPDWVLSIVSPAEKLERVMSVFTLFGGVNGGL